MKKALAVRTARAFALGQQARRGQPVVAAGADWWPLALARELDDAILSMRSNEPEIGLWLLKTAGDASTVLAADATLLDHRGHWFVRETIGWLRRAFSRLDVSSRTLFALVEPGSCFAGSLLELLLAADRAYMPTLTVGARTGSSGSASM